MSTRRVTRRAFLGMAGATAGGIAGWRLLDPDSGADQARALRTADVGPRPATGAHGPSAAPPPTGVPSTGVPRPDATSTTIPRPGRPVICPEAWGAAPPGEGLVAHVPTRLTLHHTAVAAGAPDQAPDRAVEHQRHHQNRGWPDLAYHFLVDLAGNVFRGRAIEFRGDTATGYDTAGHLLVCCDGDFENDLPSDAMLDAVVDLFAWAAAAYDIPLNTLAGHRDLAATACPGGNLQSRLPELRRMAGERSERGDVRLEELCGPAGERAVSLIRSA